MIDIDHIMKTLSARRPYFVSEMDFQLEMAWILKRLYKDCEVRMEYVPHYDSGKHIDVVLITKEHKLIPIELKYKTKKCVIDDGNQLYSLKTHGAKDINCYYYLRDIQRIEEFRDNNHSFLEGYAVMLTNDMSYTEAPRKPDCIYKEFSIHKDIASGRHEWSGASKGTIKGVEAPIVLQSDYKVNWKSYNPASYDKYGKFKFLACKIVYGARHH